MTPRRERTEPRNDVSGSTLADWDRWCGVIVQRLQVPLHRLTGRERFELLACLGKLERTAPRHLSVEARALRTQLRDKLAQEAGDALADVLANNPLAAWARWTAQALNKPTTDQLREMLAALDDTEAAVAVVAGLKPRSICPDLDGLLSACRTWVERHGELFAPLRGEVERLCDSMPADLEEENYDLAVTLLKFEAILDPLPDERDTPVEPAPFTSAVLEALIRKPTAQ